MVVCIYSEGCPFFTEVPGYSPQLHDEMKRRFCLGDSSDCARRLAKQYMSREEIPDDLMPTELARAQDLVRDLARSAEPD